MPAPAAAIGGFGPVPKGDSISPSASAPLLVFSSAQRTWGGRPWNRHSESAGDPPRRGSAWPSWCLWAPSRSRST